MANRAPSRFLKGLILTLGFFAFSLPARAYSPEGYPGSTWGNLSRDFSGLEGNGSQGRVTQGVDWFHLPTNIPFKTYAAYKWRFRSENRPFYNAQGPALGLELSKWFLDLGLDFSWQRYPELGRNTREFEAYLAWYQRIDLAGKGAGKSLLGIPILGLPLSSWGKLTHDLSDIEGDGTMGWVSQGVEWAKLPGNVVFATLASYNWRFRSENRRFYNTHGPAVGVAFIRKPFELGLEYSWKRFPELGRTTKEFQLTLNWYYSWDLKKPK